VVNNIDEFPEKYWCNAHSCSNFVKSERARGDAGTGSAKS